MVGRRRGGAAQRYNPGDRVQITIKHKIKALCARKRRGSKTVYTGRICPNGNIQWEGMRTVNPRRGLSPSACQWSRQGAAAEWVDAWVGDCDRAPTQVPQLRFLKPKRYRNLVIGLHLPRHLPPPSPSPSLYPSPAACDLPLDATSASSASAAFSRLPSPTL